MKKYSNVSSTDSVTSENYNELVSEIERLKGVIDDNASSYLKQVAEFKKLNKIIDSLRRERRSKIGFSTLR